MFNLYDQTLRPRGRYVLFDNLLGPNASAAQWWQAPFNGSCGPGSIPGGGVFKCSTRDQCVLTWARLPRACCTNKHTKLPLRVTPFLFDGPVWAHANAQGRGHIAAVDAGENKTAASAHLPNWLIDMVNNVPCESPIFIFELCDSVLMVCLALKWPRGKNRTWAL